VVSCKHFLSTSSSSSGGQTWTHREIEFLPLVEPNLSNASRILQNDVCNSTRECVRAFVAENVADMAARSDFENATTLPNLNRFFFGYQQQKTEKLFVFFVCFRVGEHYSRFD
jgi:hypothetical protein